MNSLAKVVQEEVSQGVGPNERKEATTGGGAKRASEPGNAYNSRGLWLQTLEDQELDF